MSIDVARKALYELDEKGNIVGKSLLYKMYQQNAAAYAKAKKDYADAYAEALADPIKLQNWPLAGRSYQQKIDQAYDEWKTADAAKIERALAILESVGADKG
jgi:hypothetical protein